MPPKKKTSAATAPYMSLPPPPEQTGGGVDAGGRMGVDEGALSVAKSKDKAAQRMGNTHGISNNEASPQFSSALSAGLLTKSRKTCINGYPYSRYSAYPSMGLARGFVSCRITRAFEGCR